MLVWVDFLHERYHSSSLRTRPWQRLMRWQCLEVINNVETVVAIEILAACQGIDLLREQV